jgi:hypothetical protein
LEIATYGSQPKLRVMSNIDPGNALSIHGGPNEPEQEAIIVWFP